MIATLVTNGSILGRYVARRLTDLGAVDRVIVENPPVRWGAYRRRVLRVGPVNAAFQWWLNQHYRHGATEALPSLALPAHESVPSVNAARFAHDEVVFGFGSSYVRAETLARLPYGMLNLHTGELPDYRGVKSEFWALSRGDVDHIGWTNHFMTPGLDEGDIVLQGRVKWCGESVGAVRGKLLVDAVPHAARLIEQWRSSPTTLARRPQGPGNYFSAPSLKDWLRRKFPA